jgi:hypothetical protein
MFSQCHGKKGRSPRENEILREYFTSIEDLPQKWMVQKPSETMFRLYSTEAAPPRKTSCSIFQDNDTQFR